MSTDLIDNPLIVLAIVAVLVVLVASFVLRRKAPDTHVQQASHGGVINHHQDARVIVTVTVDTGAPRPSRTDPLQGPVARSAHTGAPLRIVAGDNTRA